jgi:hypothetical protein
MKDAADAAHARLPEHQAHHQPVFNRITDDAQIGIELMGRDSGRGRARHGNRRWRRAADRVCAAGADGAVTASFCRSRSGSRCAALADALSSAGHTILSR